VKRAALLLILALAGCKKVENTPQAEAAKGGPPPIPPYQLRAELPGGDRLASGRSGEAVFSNRCGFCHLAGGMGTNLLTKQMMMAKRPPSDGLLANRTDLTSDYVTSVVRMGKGAMPHQTKVDITDAELASVAKYLGKADQ
jgi:mono/diheme cytochrome c family protein